MGLFRKKETYNERMLREAGLDRVAVPAPEPPPEPEPDENVGETTTVALAQLQGDRVQFTVLPDGDLIVTHGGEGDFAPLADAVEKQLAPPYTANARQERGNRWLIRARQIEVAQFAFPDAETVGFSQAYGATDLQVDGEPSDASPPLELQRLGERAGTDYAVEASRIDGDYWEVKVTPL